jgi:hypothetical protein
MTKYSVKIPGSWTVSSTILSDENNLKIGELCPPIIMRIDQKLLDNWVCDTESELVSRRIIKTGRYGGEKLLRKIFTPPHGDRFVHTYFLHKEERVFSIFFFETGLESRLEDLFNQIIETFEFIDYNVD